MPPATERPSTNPPSPPRRKDMMPFSNALLFLAFSFLAATGLAMEFRLDSSSASLLGVERRDWARVHALTALTVLSLVVVHVWVNWPWLRGMLARLRWPTLVVAAVGLAVLATFLIAPVR